MATLIPASLVNILNTTNPKMSAKNLESLTRTFQNSDSKLCI